MSDTKYKLGQHVHWRTEVGHNGDGVIRELWTLEGKPTVYLVGDCYVEEACIDLAMADTTLPPESPAAAPNT
jgi:hypothetical protein